jgi:hypothetical protein
MTYPDKERLAPCTSARRLTIGHLPTTTSGLLPQQSISVNSYIFPINFPPSHTVDAFGHRPPPQIRQRIVSVLPSTPLRAFIGRNFNTTTGSSTLCTLHSPP